MDVGQAIRGRRSVGAFGDRPVPRATVAELIEAASWAPTHHLTQPWRFAVLAGDARAALAAAIVAADPTAGVARTAHAKLTRAPVCIVVGQCIPPDADPVLEREDYAACACAVQNLMLAAQAAGLASKWSTGALAESAAAKRHLGLAPGDRIVAYVYLGYGLAPPADGTARRRRRSIGVASSRNPRAPSRPSRCAGGGRCAGRQPPAAALCPAGASTSSSGSSVPIEAASSPAPAGAAGTWASRSTAGFAVGGSGVSNW